MYAWFSYNADAIAKRHLRCITLCREMVTRTRAEKKKIIKNLSF